MNVLEIDKLSVSINQASLLRDIDLQAHAGEILVIAGPNGAGKSTLLKAISGDIEPSSGGVILAGKALSQWPLEQLARVRGMQTQLSLLNFPYRVEEVVALGRSPHATGKQIDDEIVDELIEAMDLQHIRTRLYTKLSGGEKQRTQLARVIAQVWRKEDAEQRILILDEPTTALDLGHQQQLTQFLKKLAAQGVCIIVVVHDLNTAAKIADKVLLLCCGETMAFGTPAEVFQEALLEKVFGAMVKVVSHPDTQELVILS